MAADTSIGGEAVDHLPLLRRRSFALTRNRADAEDLVQDAYVRALRAAESFQPGTNLRAWLLTILRNLTLNHRRDQQRWHTLFEPADAGADLAVATPDTISPEAILLEEVVSPALRAALESLPKGLRDAVWLRDVEDLSYREMAAHLRIPIGTVMSRIARGRRLLHDRLLAGVRSPESRSTRDTRS